jgi:hypothetical protein
MCSTVESSKREGRLASKLPVDTKGRLASKLPVDTKERNKMNLYFVRRRSH